MPEISIRRCLALPVLVLAVLAQTACDKKSINQIMADPGRYAHEDVGIIGTVTQSYSVLGRGAYEVDDGTGRLWVVSTKGVPRKSARVAVKGRIRDGFELGSLVKLPQVVSSGMVMIESSHKAKY